MFSWRDVQSKYGRIIALQKLPAGSMSAGGPKSSKLAKWMNEENGQIYEISRKKNEHLNLGWNCLVQWNLDLRGISTWNFNILFSVYRFFLNSVIDRYFWYPTWFHFKKGKMGFLKSRFACIEVHLECVVPIRKY